MLDPCTGCLSRPLVSSFVNFLPVSTFLEGEGGLLLGCSCRG